MITSPPRLKPICIYCQSAPAEELDHTLPVSWYPDGTDPKVQRVTVPCCKPCGAKLKNAEQQMSFAIMMARGFDRDHLAASGVYDQVRKSWNAAEAKTPRERQHRARKLRSVLTRVQPVVVPPEQAIGAPTIKVRTPAGLWIDAAVALKFRRSDFDAVAEKLVRGLLYDRTGKLLPVGTRFTSVEPPEEAMKDAAQLTGGTLSRALSYRFIEPENGDGRAIWFFYFWEQVKMGVLVEPPGTSIAPA